MVGHPPDFAESFERACSSAYGSGVHENVKRARPDVLRGLPELIGGRRAFELCGYVLQVFCHKPHRFCLTGDFVDGTLDAVVQVRGLWFSRICHQKLPFSGGRASGCLRSAGAHYFG
jgi:hypothetical protein